MDVALNNPSITAASCLKKLREEISGAGVTWGDFRKLLPDWSDAAIKHISGVTEVRGFAMKHLGLQAANDGGLRFQSLPNAAFKTREGTDLAQIQVARAFAWSVARLLSNAMTVPWKGLPDDVDRIRATALSASNNPWVDFAGLLDVAWSAGIPVAYLPKLPTTGKKMDGMVRSWVVAQ